ncbi:MFS transporter [Rahnella sp. C60]|uniref:MFS transporter n=1 Tax=Rahnella TaxID=34037 RepID=UPI0010218B86|nr:MULTISPECIES: MFS transporter [Rahnella]UJD91846.1 MFS transporter [Rahnella aquatilis]MBU9811001.1 MFS transporter [Rahnella perminowiae]MBU9816208.1 MFS transporter [Rahnella perminowiae]MCR9003340.1 MFS transporter [Rahnella perminowiae]MCX2944372.1 MFS transporter [Rahnella perminowiae]
MSLSSEIESLNSHAGSPARRIATRAIFFVTGMAMGLWAALVPYAQLRTHSEAGDLGLLLLCLGAGSLLSMLGSGRIIGRFGCRAVIVAAVVLYCLMLPVLAVFSDIWLLALSLFIFGMGIGLADVAVNVQGTLVEQAADKPLMSGFHCLWSVGGIAGAGGGALLLSAGITPLGSTFFAVALVVIVTAWSFRGMLPFGAHEEEGAEGKPKARPNFRLVLMAVMAMICFMAEGAVLDWGGVFLTRERGLALEHAGWGFAVFAVAMSLMRLTGDVIVSALGRKRILVAGGILGIAGYLMVVLLPGWILPLCGFALVGIGAANIVPVLITLAGQEKVMPVNMSVAMVATLGYLGVLGGPALIGFIAHLSSLYVAFSAVAAAFLIITFGAYKLKY